MSLRFSDYFGFANTLYLNKFLYIVLGVYLKVFAFGVCLMDDYVAL